MSYFMFMPMGFNPNAAVEPFPSYCPQLGCFQTGSIEIPSLIHYPSQWQAAATLNSIATSAKDILAEKSQTQAAKSSVASLRELKSLQQKSIDKEILSAKKNSQSNIINQFYSFFSSQQKSQKTVLRCIGLLGKEAGQVQALLSMFYTAIRYINAKRGRKYVNISMFLKFFSADQFGEHLPEVKKKVECVRGMSVDDLCQVFRRCARKFLEEIGICAMLTSKRISVLSKSQHLKKRRKMSKIILGM